MLLPEFSTLFFYGDECTDSWREVVWARGSLFGGGGRSNRALMSATELINQMDSAFLEGPELGLLGVFGQPR